MHLRWGLRWLALASVAAVVLGGVAAASEADILKSDRLGCFERGDVERLDRVIAGGGKGDFVRVADTMLAAGRCVSLRAGKTIRVDDAADRYLCLFTAPGLPCAWTWRERLTD
jgi:hypothetical protein